MINHRLQFYGGDHASDIHPNLSARTRVRGHLDGVLRSCILDYVSAPSGRVEYNPEAEPLISLVGFEEKDIALKGVFFLSDARAQAQMPLGKAAARHAYRYYLRQAAAIASQSIGENSLRLGRIFTSQHAQMRRLRAETYDLVRSEVVPAAGSGIDYAAAVVLGDAAYPGLEIPHITHPILVADIRTQLLDT